MDLKEHSEIVEDFFTTVATVEDGRGNMQINFIGMPRHWRVTIETANEYSNERTLDLVGEGSTLFLALKNMIVRRG